MIHLKNKISSILYKTMASRTKSKSKSKSKTLTFRRGGVAKAFKKAGVYKGKSKAIRVSNESTLNSVMKGFRSPAPFPNYMIKKLRYSASHVYNVGTSGVLGDQQMWLLNSCHDIDETGYGHQPYGYDQLSAIYNRYKVIGTHIKLTISDPTADSIAVCYQLTNPSNSSPFINTLDPTQVAEQNMSGMAVINDSGSQKLIKRFYVPMHVVAGITKLQFKADPDNYTADTGSSPANKMRLLLACGSLRGASSGSVVIVAEFEQVVLFYQRKVLSQS